MKLQLKLLAVAASLLLTALPMTVSADTEPATDAVTETVTETQGEITHYTSADGQYNYVLSELGTAGITQFNPYETYKGDLVIPSEIDGYTVTYLGNGSFAHAPGITSVTIPATVTSIGEGVFFNCTALEKFVVEEGNTMLSTTEDGVLIADENQFLIAYPIGRLDTSYTVPETVDEIAPFCFAQAFHLQEVILPDGLISVDSYSFAWSSLRSITFPDSALVIDTRAFANCVSLSQVDLGANMAEIYQAAFESCSKLEEITLPKTLTYVGQSAFIGTGLKSVTIPTSVQTIEFCAFGYDANFDPVDNFVIYGAAGSQAQLYCTASDEENDYQNNFAFVEVSSQKANGEPETQPVTQATAAADPGNENSGTGNLLKIILGAGAGVAAVLVAVLAVLVLKKPKAEKKQEETDETPAEEAEQDDEA